MVVPTVTLTNTPVLAWPPRGGDRERFSRHRDSGCIPLVAR